MLAGGPMRAVQPRPPPMVPPTPTPSARLVRAAAAERADVARHRERLLGARERLRAELAGIEAALRELDERDTLLDRLAGPRPAAVPAATADADAADAIAAGPTSAPGAVSAEAAAGARLARLGGEAGGGTRGLGSRGGTTGLRGPAIRPAPGEGLRALPERPQALHSRAWFAAVRAAGFEVAGKDPLAVFLTQLSRSPVVRRGTQSGVYALDPDAPRRLRDRLDVLHADLRGLTAAPTATTDLTAIRARRAAITTQITQVEKALEEAEAVLAPGDGRSRGSVAVAG